MIQRRKRRSCPKYGVDPENAKDTGPDYGTDRRIQCVPAAAQNAGRYFIKITDRLKQENAQDPHSGAFDHGRLRRKKRREQAAEQNNHKNRNRTAHS